MIKEINFTDNSMDFLRNNQELKIIPGDIKGISNGVIQDVNTDYFSVELNNLNDNFAINDRIEVIIPLETCLVRFETHVAKIENKKVCFTIPQKFRYVQRREYTRVNVNIPVELKDLNTSKSTDSVAENLSGGGMQLVSTEDFSIGSLLEANFSILSRDEIKSVLKVLRINESEHQKKEYQLSSEFKEISNTDRTAIIQLCFKRQLEIKCKEVKPD